MSLDMARKVIFPEREPHSVSKAPGTHIDLPVSASLGQGVKIRNIMPLTRNS